MILSICIPTYNRSAKVKGTLTELIKQIKKNNLENYCEILVSESSDKKSELLNSSFKRKIKRYARFIKPNIKSDFASNLLNLYFNSKGKYSWLLGDDDYIFDKTLVTLVNTIRLNQINSSYITFRCSGKPGKKRSKTNDIYFKSLPAKVKNHKNFKNFINMSGSNFIAKYWLSTIFMSLCVFKTREFVEFINKKKIYKSVDPNYPHSNLLIPFIKNREVTVLLDILLEDSFNLKYYTPRDKFIALVSSWLNYTCILKKDYKIGNSAILEMRKIGILQIISIFKYTLLFHLSQNSSIVCKKIFFEYFSKPKKFSITKNPKELFIEYCLLKMFYFIIKLINKKNIFSNILINILKLFDQKYYSISSINSFSKEYNLILKNEVNKVHYVN